MRRSREAIALPAVATELVGAEGNDVGCRLICSTLRDLLKSQMRCFGKPRGPFYIALSQDDEALQPSQFIAAGESRAAAAKTRAIAA